MTSIGDCATVKYSKQVNLLIMNLSVSHAILITQDSTIDSRKYLPVHCVI